MTYKDTEGHIHRIVVTPEVSGRNPREYGGDVSKVTANRTESGPEEQLLMEAVVERKNYALLDQHLKFQSTSRTAVYGTVRTVV